MKMHIYTETTCEFCGKPLRDNDGDIGEFFNPEAPHEAGSLIGHVPCATSRGWERA